MGCDVALLERAELRFRGDIWRTAPTDAVLEAGVQMRQFGPVLVTVFADLPDVAAMNAVQGAAEPGAVAGGHLVEAIDWTREWEVDYIVPVASKRPETGPAEAWLAANGYEQSGIVRKYIRPASPPGWQDPPEIEVRKLAPRETEGMSYLAVECLGLPDMVGFLFCDLPELEGWHCYVALLDGVEVACGSMLIADGIATLGVDATAEHARGQRLQRRAAGTPPRGRRGGGLSHGDGGGLRRPGQRALGGGAQPPPDRLRRGQPQRHLALPGRHFRVSRIDIPS